MLLDPADARPGAGRAGASPERAAGDPRFKLELPAAQLELLTRPHGTRRGGAGGAGAAPAPPCCRRADGLVRPAAAGVHPFAAAEGALNPGARYERDRGASTAACPPAARRRRCRCTSPWAAPSGRWPSTTRCASTSRAGGARRQRALPRRGATPGSPRSGRRSRSAAAPGRAAGDRGWDELAARARAGARRPERVPEPRAGGGSFARTWRYGTLELRVPDAQTTVADAAAIAARGPRAGGAGWPSATTRASCWRPVPTWRIEENRWVGLRDGVEGELADLATRRASRPRASGLHALLDELEPRRPARRAAELAAARALVERNGAMRQRERGRARLARGRLADWLADRFCEGFAGKRAACAGCPSHAVR